MTNPELTLRIIAQGKALVRAIEALGTIEPSGPFERAIARLLQAEDLEALKEAGILDVVHKPLEASALAQVVRSALDAD